MQYEYDGRSVTDAAPNQAAHAPWLAAMVQHPPPITHTPVTGVGRSPHANFQPSTHEVIVPRRCACSNCGLCDTYYVAHVKEACAFLGEGAF